VECGDNSLKNLRAKCRHRHFAILPTKVQGLTLPKEA
jgi:hypothetical protein